MPRTRIPVPAYDPARPRVHAAAQVATAVDEPGPSGMTNGGRWLAYDGSVVRLEIWGLNMQTDVHGCEYPEPVDIITELASCRPYKGEIPALWNHYDEAIIGRWIDIEVTEAGVIASAILYDPTGRGRGAGAPASWAWSSATTRWS